MNAVIIITLLVQSDWGQLVRLIVGHGFFLGAMVRVKSGKAGSA